MKKLTILLGLLLWLPIGMAAAETPEGLLKKVIDNLGSETAVSAEYTITSNEGNASGIIILSGDKFTIKGDGIASWYDGKTMWAYSESTGEVNVTEPTDDELAEINPLVILKSDPDTYKKRIKKKSGTHYLIELTDKTGDMNIAKATVTIAESTFMPETAEVETSGGDKLSLTLKNVKKQHNVSPSAFKFNPKELPGVEVIDLR